jgi:hypothetical protein
MLRELSGLFVEDQASAITIALVLIAMLVASAAGIATPPLRAIALFVGLAAALLLGVYRFRKPG